MPKKPAKATAQIEQLNETGMRKLQERRENIDSVTAERRKSPRRRQIDPTTCERDYDDAEIEFMHALDEYKQRSGRMFPTCSEILEVLLSLGYRKNVPAPVGEANPPILLSGSGSAKAASDSCCQGSSCLS